MVCRDHGERDLAIGGGVEGTFGAGGDLDSVADGATVTAAVEDKRMIGQHGSRKLSSRMRREMIYMKSQESRLEVRSNDSEKVATDENVGLFKSTQLWHLENHCLT